MSCPRLLLQRKSLGISYLAGVYRTGGSGKDFKPLHRLTHIKVQARIGSAEQLRGEKPIPILTRTVSSAGQPSIDRGWRQLRCRVGKHVLDIAERLAGLGACQDRQRVM